ncbi:DUF6789 family protein [Bailinhaonella thermotolerans]|uniref:DUF6789 family protein n=1 Tax=Bailinhaonella thermotolerans TaxID=1070861 RepID=UPI00192A4B80|nr:DUF6789 family protein [Bailinhaonella thermotolerans]
MSGAAGGALATAAMSAVMYAGDKAGLMPDQPPKRITRAVLPGGRSLPKPGEGALGLVSHFAFGTAAGALLSLLRGNRRVPPAAGAAYGLAIWLASYQGWVPAIGALPPITRDHPSRAALMAAAHIAYGTTLATALNRARPTPPTPWPPAAQPATTPHHTPAF